MASHEDADVSRSRSRSPSRGRSVEQGSGPSGDESEKSVGWRAQQEASARAPAAILKPGRAPLPRDPRQRRQ
eukprot:12546055-Alexandrium_andersonii.AAC.1